MLVPQVPKPSAQITIGAAVSLLVFGALLLCLNGCGAAITPAIVECKLNALEPLPRDPMRVTPYDVADLVTRINACEAGAADAGKP